MSSDALHLLLLRHGQTDANQRGIIQGHSQTALNELGQRQSKLLAQRLAEFRPRIERLICSDLLRAQQTVAPIAKALNLEVFYDAAWRERNYGPLEGLSVDQCPVLRRTTNLGEVDLPSGVQTGDQYVEQIRLALLELVARHRNAGCIGVVTHGGACQAVAVLLGENRLLLDPDSVPPDLQQSSNCAITHLLCTWRGSDPMARLRIACANDTDHLRELITSRDAG
jgi:broad specificity phosphatase PhoE